MLVPESSEADPTNASRCLIYGSVCEKGVVVTCEEEGDVVQEKATVLRPSTIGTAGLSEPEMTTLLKGPPSLDTRSMTRQVSWPLGACDESGKKGIANTTVFFVVNSGLVNCSLYPRQILRS